MQQSQLSEHATLASTALRRTLGIRKIKQSVNKVVGRQMCV